MANHKKLARTAGWFQASMESNHLQGILDLPDLVAHFHNHVAIAKTRHWLQPKESWGHRPPKFRRPA